MERRAEINRQEEFQFLVTNGQREEIQTTASGLQYEILSEGDGERPGPNSVVRVNYIGTFTDGTPFDSSYEDEGALIPMGLVIPGWAEGLSLMPVGSKYRFFVPSSLAYGKDGIQSIIPPYSTLIFVVDLLEIVSEDMADFNP
jgi:FKBP-type peptidyl-prolyl cis-trans isomerase